jgi:xylulokinase
MELRLHTTGVENATGIVIERYIAVGGGARSKLWCQIIADVTGKAIFLADTYEASALGAGILAAVGSGLFREPFSAAEAMTRIQPQPFLPDAERGAFYQKLYSEVYSTLYPTLRASLNKLADLVESQYDG